MHRTTKYQNMEQNLSEMQGGIENSTIIMRDFKTPLSIENVGKRSIGKELNNIISLQDLTVIVHLPNNRRIHSYQIPMEQSTG